ncbi:N-acetylmuramoyl-L-alanine amidase [Thermosporothrix hazakensis]|jgi:N-acetyl-anhydromuramyl-L-alanine amidase AmpD|uniref:N-acetylmuramoyl-L-alanine amidase n=1 Tax=Thermosporothrix hazakensis TaxID=644383 RepID=A0A326U6H4_THEHA|nr:N-acetylmuramoyl-L-alanine amidase [Thermosporothrix hazakensis]PZW28410.1 N-acetylmuramoyl-L-alanine amidase [Thermosporothrix hazakensis]GCE45190.1 hypothetical protein KTH_00590 [Thermosporothrix hazakensis]
MILSIPSPNYMSRQGRRPRWVILHGTAGFHKAEDCGYYFQQPSSQVSSHYVIGQDGTIVQCVDEAQAAWANGVLDAGADSWWYDTPNPNYDTISIEHIKPHTDNSDEITPAQKAASFRLIAQICARWGIPTRPADAQGGITGHFSIAPINRSGCPGPYPWDELFNYLNGTSSDDGDEMKTISLKDASSFFEQAPGNAWRCKKNNCVVGNAILDFYRRFGGDALCGLSYLGLPLNNEHPVTAKDGSKVIVQDFERGSLAYDPAHKLDGPPGVGAIYLTHRGVALEVQELRRQLEDAKKQNHAAEVETLKKQVDGYKQAVSAAVKTLQSIK